VTRHRPATHATEPLIALKSQDIQVREWSPRRANGISSRHSRRHGLSFDPAIVQYLQDKYYTARRLEMRACHPRDLTDQVVNLCRYHRRRAEITPELLDEVCQSYFLEDSQTGSTAAKAR
jgi:hypothetical protein